eukprot:1981368-Rhodomonas_salina.3
MPGTECCRPTRDARYGSGIRCYLCGTERAYGGASGTVHGAAYAGRGYLRTCRQAGLVVRGDPGQLHSEIKCKTTQTQYRCIRPRARYAKPGTGLAHRALLTERMLLHTLCTKPGTDVAYSATRCPVLTAPMAVPDFCTRQRLRAWPPFFDPRHACRSCSWGGARRAVVPGRDLGGTIPAALRASERTDAPRGAICLRDARY